jgi:fumarylpyruvate hydrolase
MTQQSKFVFAPSIPSLPVTGSERRFPVRRIYCVGRNYLAHIREMQEADERDPPFFFQKPSDAIVQNGGVLAYPFATTDYQYEVELVVAIGKPGSDIAPGDALPHVFGYSVGLDMTRRDLQRDARDRSWPWEMGKSFDESAPCGALHEVAAVGHPDAGRIGLTVNGVQTQHGDIGQMIWHVPEIIAKLSQQYALQPGDLIFTGTPAGVGPVVTGDVLRGQIDGLDALEVTVGPRGTC